MLGFLDKKDKTTQTEEPQFNADKILKNNISSIKSCEYLHKVSNNSTKESAFLSKYQKDSQLE